MKPEVINTANEFRVACEGVRQAGGTVGLVPTMGALHQGHAALMRHAATQASCVAATVFVNPTQFGPNEDFSRYPRTLDRDIQCCEAAGVKLLFVPSVQEMYPEGECTRVRVAGLTHGLCGAARPGHFDGVSTIVTKLFVLAGACVAVFGKKDYQQLRVIQRAVRDLLLPVQIEAHRIVREPDGLAVSSRNAYLAADERARAVGIVRGLSAAFGQFDRGERRVGVLTRAVEAELTRQRIEVQYVTIADAERLTALASEATCPQRALLAVAAYCGATRLIDNVVLGEDTDPLTQRQM